MEQIADMTDNDELDEPFHLFHKFLTEAEESSDYLRYESVANGIEFLNGEL